MLYDCDTEYTTKHSTASYDVDKNSSLHLEEAHTNEINHDIHLANTLF